MQPSNPKPDTSQCPRCGAGLRCGKVAGDSECWCQQLPHVMPVPSAPLQGSAETCFCPACFKKITDERQHQFLPASH